MERNFPQQIILIIALILNACGSGNPVITELSNDFNSYDEIIHINNCGNKAQSVQTILHSFSAKIAGTTNLKAGYDKIVEGSISATYEQFKSVSKTQILTAAPDTNMEFVLRWSDDVRVGSVILDGEIANYTVNIPVSVDQISSKDLGCGSTIITLTESPTPIPADNLIICHPFSEQGKILQVSHDGKYIIATNVSNLVVAIRISIDNLDINGNSSDPKISTLDNTVYPNENVTREINDNSSAQVWAWNTSGNCIDAFWLEIK